MVFFLHSEREITYNGVFPIYDSFTEVMKPVEAFNAIINTAPSSKVVCLRKPVGIRDAAVFLVDTTKLKHPNDLKADDMGSWIHKGKPIRHFEIERVPQSGEVYGAKPCDHRRDDSVYKLTRIYYHHRGTSEFRRTIFYVHSKLGHGVCS